MGKFFPGFLLGAFVVSAGVLFTLLMGYVDPRADTPVSPVENAIFMPSLDASVKHYAPAAMDTIPIDKTNLMDAIKLYQSNCAECHGDPVHPVSEMSGSFKPRAPQFLEDPPDMLKDQDFFIIKHGVRWTGMPAWGDRLEDHQIWQLALFLDQIGNLSPTVKDAWKTAAGGAGQPGVRKRR